MSTIELLDDRVTAEFEPRKRGRLIVITGPTASGKNSIIRELAQRLNARRIVTYTTRAPREKEANVVDYNFVSPEEFNRLKEEGKIVFDNQRDSNWDGTCREDVEPFGDQDAILSLDISAAGQIEEKLKEVFGDEKAGKIVKNLIVIYVDANEGELKKRFLARANGDRPNVEAEFAERYKRDMADWELFGGKWQSGGSGFLRIFNTDLDQAVRDCFTLIQYIRPKIS